jgi:hypothetical protein
MPTGRLRLPAALAPRRWARIAVVVVTEPPLVPPVLWPRTISADLLNRRLPEVVEIVLDHLDLTGLIIEHVSVDRILDSLDMTELIGRMNLPAVVEKVLDDIDLPSIVRGSTGTLASETVVGVRVQSAEADALIDRTVARILPRRREAISNGG